MPKVYVVQEMRQFDITPALEFGEVKTILPPGDTAFSYDHVVKEMHVSLKDIQPDDYLLLTGDPIAIGLAVTIAQYYLNQLHSTVQPVRLLKWLRREFKYLPVVIDPGV